ncbi:SHOCT domain-containing protein [Micromonospora echinaurantiaca]|uniref:SHOCT domain-containing protein n=1 Tax=Micromonospora TaxID=1873 RepID=UPI001E38D5BE|nr:SHOCT domain-containing protein [Micromonospora sp. S4605]
MHGIGWMWPMGGMMVGWLVLIVALGAVVWLAASRSHPSGAGDSLGSARRILAERYARGEIDTDEYEQRLGALR